MPFIDLSSPGDSLTKNAAPDKNPDTNQQTAAVKTAEINSATGTSTEAKTTEPHTPEKEKVSESGQSAADYQKHVLEEHELMRNIPVLEETGTVKVDESGVKEYQGPPLPSDAISSETTKAEAKDAPSGSSNV